MGRVGENEIENGSKIGNLHVKSKNQHFLSVRLARPCGLVAQPCVFSHDWVARSCALLAQPCEIVKKNIIARELKRIIKVALAL